MNNFSKYIRNTVVFAILMSFPIGLRCQINTNQVMTIGRNALYFEDYLLSIQYFNQVIKAKPYLADPYFYRAIAKLYLEDYGGAEQDCSLAIERNPFIVDAYQVRGIARQTLGKNKEAIEDYSKGLEQMPEHKTFLMNKAVAEEEIKDYDNSQNTYARLIKLYPRYGTAYLGRAQLNLAMGDTINALSDIDKCIENEKNNANAYVMRSGIYSDFKKDYSSALKDMDEAIKLEPRFAGYFINRAYLKYNLDDYFGAMSDYDYSIDLDPENITARFNRGLLLAEVQETNKAIDDFSFVIAREPSNIMARYNRAELYTRLRQYKKAIVDYDAVIDQIPDMAGLYYARSECKRNIGDMIGGERDYNKFKKLRYVKPDVEEIPNKGENDKNSEDVVKNKFKQLLTIKTDNSVKPEYDRKNRGKIQDGSFKIDAESQFMLSYYQVVNELKTSSNYSKELTELNEARVLPFTLMLANEDVRLYEEQINRHFESITYYTGVLGAGDARAIDYFARAMEYIMVKNYESAIVDLDKAIEISDKFMLAFFARANARYKQWKSEMGMAPAVPIEENNAYADRLLRDRKKINGLAAVISDLDKVLELSPKMIYAHYNKGCVLLEMQDYTAALSAFTKAIELKPDMGEAYYNRGLVYLRLGNRESGIADLSRAGEFGITPSYSVLKRMAR